MSSGGVIALGDGSFSTSSVPVCDDGSVGWQCAVASCPTGSPTTLTGKVFDPAGLNPLYDVVVFIPRDRATLPAITTGTNQCNSCDVSIGNYVAATQTDYAGTFTLQNVPTGMNVPVTVQIGKWRRTITMDIPNSCGVNQVSTSASSSPLLRLPRNKSEGDMPQMAVLTGGCDDMACFLMNLGISASEFGAPHSGSRVDVYQGNSSPLGANIPGGGASLSNGTAGNCTTQACPLWASKQSFEYYDIAMFSCECGEEYVNSAQLTSPDGGARLGFPGTQTPQAYTNLRDWLDEGGKVFASHYHYTWFEYNPSADFRGVANWGNTGNNDTATSAQNGAPYDIDNTFPKAITLGQWLQVVGALANGSTAPTMLNQNPAASLDLKFVGDSVVSVNVPTSRWIYDPNVASHEGGVANNVKYLSFETPIGGVTPPDGGEQNVQYCGKAVYTDLHTGGSLYAQAMSVPADCTAGALSAQQKALEFLFFDLSACVAPDNQSPPPPPLPLQ